MGRGEGGERRERRKTYSINSRQETYSTGSGLEAANINRPISRTAERNVSGTDKKRPIKSMGGPPKNIAIPDGFSRVPRRFIIRILCGRPVFRVRVN